MPPLAPTFLKVDLVHALSPSIWPFVFVFLFMLVFDTIGTFIGVCVSLFIMSLVDDACMVPIDIFPTFIAVIMSLASAFFTKTRHAIACQRVRARMPGLLSSGVGRLQHALLSLREPL